MQRRTPLFLTAALTAAVLACGSAAVALPAAADAGAAPHPVADAVAGPASVPEPTGSTSVPTPAQAQLDLTVVLRPDDEAGLRELPVAAAGATPTDRQDAIAEVAPLPQHGAVARAVLTAAGFSVTDAGAWELSARGTAAQAEALFGVQLTGTADGVHPSTDPVLPAAFGDSVVAVLGLDARPVAAHSAVAGGSTTADLAKLYSASTAASAGAGATIATVQFSGWNRGDLATYAAAAGRPVPAVEQVSVDGASPSRFDGNGGETEVALDQEALLATAPAARQRIYVAPNSLLGMYDAYSEIADDVVTHGITAVSISWGACESLLGASNRTVLENAIDRIVAAGATVFASSGDSGTACPTGSGSVTSVSYPASSPAVVAVGGTEVFRSGSTYQETAWGNRYGSSGGGVSVFARPSWQTGAGISGTKRLVPDISAVADPASGPVVYMHSGGGWVLGGGTSLSAPVLAGQLAATLVQRGCAVGVGDVHAALYANPRAFRDVVSGGNDTDRAGAGYDRVTGLGTPNWSALSAVLPVAAGCQQQSTAPARASGTQWTAQTSALPGERSIHSDNGQYWFELQTDGNLVEWGNGRVLWQTGATVAGAALRLVPGSTFAVVDASGAVRWDSRAMVSATSTLQVQANGDVVLADGATRRWHTGVGTTRSLAPGGWLAGGQSLVDSNGVTRLTMRTDGILALTIRGKQVWSRSAGPGAVVKMGVNGDLVLRDQYGRRTWHSATSGRGAQLAIRVDGDLRVVVGTKTTWRTKTHV